MRWYTRRVLTEESAPAPRAQAEPYDRSYFEQGCGRPYHRDEFWLGWFGRIADRIVKEIAPTTAMDAGCAMGFLVEALRDRGVDASGIDISEYALSQVREDIKPYCVRGSLTEEFPRQYSLVVCVEVLEHLPPDQAELAAANICRHTDDLLFSSTSTDFKEATHINVRPPEYWAELFARQGFYRDVDYDASYVAPWAVRFRRGRDPIPRQFAGYERLVARLREETQSLRDLAAEHRGRLTQQEAELENLRGRVERAEAMNRNLSTRVARRLAPAASKAFPRQSRRGSFLRWIVSKVVPAP